MFANRNWLKYGAVLGFFAVAMGAFGAHALEGQLTERYEAVYETASKYALIHSVLICSLSLLSEIKIPRSIFLAFLFGVVIFSGTLWILSIFEIKWMGAITPLGGLCLLFGWLRLAWWGKQSCKDSE